MTVSKQLLRFCLLCAVTFVLITGCLAWFPGVWLPDIGGQVSELCSTETSTGEKFQITHFWGDDFYTIRFDHWSPDGSRHTQVIEGDAKKHWRPCAMQLDEAGKKLIIYLHDGHASIDYRWGEKKFIMPPGAATITRLSTQLSNRRCSEPRAKLRLTCSVFAIHLWLRGTLPRARGR